jgi:hypothetical protein
LAVLAEYRSIVLSGFEGTHEERGGAAFLIRYSFFLLQLFMVEAAGVGLHCPVETTELTDLALREKR